MPSIAMIYGPPRVSNARIVYPQIRRPALQSPSFRLYSGRMILNIVAARPNFVKMAPLILEMRRRGLPQFVVHTGQHYDAAMSAIFIDELGMPEPDLDLEVGSGSHADQTARIMVAFEHVCLTHSPQLVVVAGDVNSTLACALVAAKLCIPVAHVESGLRSHDRTMPEEINRVLTDHIADLLFTTEPDGDRNLASEGIPSHKVFHVGNPMIDSLQKHVKHAVARRPWESFNLSPRSYGLVTFHRPSNVDDPVAADQLAAALGQIAQELPLLFPVHPRTLKSCGSMLRGIPGLRLTEPLGYLEFIGLMANAQVVITDSGGVQEETTFLQVPCVTVRRSTERPVTVTEGTNVLASCSTADILEAVAMARKKRGRIPRLWDGSAAVRIVDVIERWLADRQGNAESAVEGR